jgi:predicted nucleotidyltransferase
MKSMSYDFSARTELRALAALNLSLGAAAKTSGIEYFLMGAAARDLILRYAHGIQAARATEDVDFAVMVRDWAQFDALRTELLASGRFHQRPGAALHRMMHSSGLPLDIVPFGGVERPDRTIAWPGSDGTIHDCFGVNEAFAACVDVVLPGGGRLGVAPIPALAVLKVAAWHDRKLTQPGRDAADLLLFARTYMDCIGFEHAIAIHPDLFEALEFDYVEAGARVLGRDMRRLMGEMGARRVAGILFPQTDAEGALLLAHQSGMDIESARRLIEAMCEEMN